MKKTVLLFTLLASISSYSCKHNNDVKPHSSNDQMKIPCDSLNITFESHIKAIMDAACSTPTCHAKGGSVFPLQTYEQVRASALFPSFLGTIRHEDGFTAMPFPPGSPKIGEDLIRQIECWEKLGLPEK
ncbi:MAG: hypothetical protein JJ975_06815 [Bacteroidia bacterium]|nr:hypothetical protein [Bacteroidia bacterium]